MSTDDDIPTLRQASRDVTRAVDHEIGFEPNAFQERVKARFYRRIDEMSHVYDKETVFADKSLVTQMAGTDRIVSWLEKPEFATWFVDADLMIDTIASQQQRNLETIMEIRDNRDARDGDRLKAATTMLELADAFPGKKSEVKFLDERINDLSESETDKEIKKLQAKLGQAKLGAIDE